MWIENGEPQTVGSYTGASTCALDRHAQTQEGVTAVSQTVIWTDSWVDLTNRDDSSTRPELNHLQHIPSIPISSGPRGVP